MNFSFFLKNSQAVTSLVYLVCRDDGKRIKISTGIKVKTADWSAKDARILKNHSGQEVNSRLDQIESAAKNAYHKARYENLESTTELFERVKRDVLTSNLHDRKDEVKSDDDIFRALDTFIGQLRAGKRPTKRKIDVNVSESYVKLFQILKSVLSKDIIPAGAKFKYLKSVDFEKRFNAYRTANWSDNSAGKYIRLFRRFLLWAGDRNLINVSEMPECLALPKDNETTLFALTKEELSAIENLDLTDRPALDRVRDLFLISTFSGLRYSDVSRLGKEHIAAKEILMSAQKTGESVRCPIHPRLRKVLDKYAPNYDFRKISGQKANDHLKTIATLAGIADRMEIVTWKNGKKTISVKAKNEIISWHCARRTFITLSLILGVNQAAVQAVSGHKKDSKSFHKYVLYSTNQVDDAINSAWG